MTSFESLQISVTSTVTSQREGNNEGLLQLMGSLEKSVQFLADQLRTAHKELKEQLDAH